MLTRFRGYQQKAVDDIRGHLAAGGKGPVFVLPTGGGKTVTFVYIAENAAKRGKSVCIVVHRDELVWQASAELTRWGVDHGIIAADQKMLRRGVQVASVWTLVRRLEHFKHFDLLIIDEAHHAVAGSWRKVIDHMPFAKLLGVTATPARLDGKGLGHIFDGIVMGPRMSELIAAGHLSAFDIYAPQKLPDLKGVKKKAGDYDKEELEIRVNNKAITGNAIEHYRRYLNGAPSIAFCVSIKHAEIVAEEFRAAGFNAVSVDGTMQKEHRKKLIGDLASGRLNVLTSCELISEGVDVPTCYGGLLLRPTQSLVLYMQQVGRALRPKPNGGRAVILDHAGNCLRHGMPNADRSWSLADGIIKGTKDEEDRKLTKTCKNCYAIYEIWRAYCPQCQHVTRNENGSLPDEVAGELLKQAGINFSTPMSQIPARRLMAAARTREQLMKVAEAKGYDRRWVDRILEARATKKLATASRMPG